MLCCWSNGKCLSCSFFPLLSDTDGLISCGAARYLHMCGWALQADAAGALCCCLSPAEPQLTVITSIFKGDALHLVTSPSSSLLMKSVLKCLTESCGETDHLVGGEGGKGAMVPSVQLQFQLPSSYMTQVPSQADHLQPARRGRLGN